MDDLKYLAPEVGSDQSLIIEDTNPQPEENVTATEALKSGFRFWNTGVTEGMQDVIYNSLQEQGTFNPFNSDLVKYEDQDLIAKWSDRIATSNNEVELLENIQKAKSWKRSLDIAEMDLKGFANNSAYFVGALAGLILDPTNLVGASWITKGVKAAGVTTNTLGKIALGATEGAAVGLTTTTLQGQLSKTTFAASESEVQDWQVLGLVGGAVLGGVLGSKGIIHAKMAEDPVTSDLIKLNKYKSEELTKTVDDSSIGAAEFAGEEVKTGLITPEMPNNWVSQKIFQFTHNTMLGNVQPKYQVLAKSKSRFAQVSMLQTTGSPLKYEGLMQKDLKTPMEQKMVSELVNDNTYLDQNLEAYYANHVKDETKMGKLSKDAWLEEYHNVLNTNVPSKYDTVNKFVTEIHDPLYANRLQLGKEYGLFGEDFVPEAGKHYVHRELDINAMMYNRQKAYETFEKAILKKEQSKVDALNVKLADKRTAKINQLTELKQMEDNFVAKLKKPDGTFFRMSDKQVTAAAKLKEQIKKLEDELTQTEQKVELQNTYTARIKAEELVDNWISDGFKMENVKTNAVKTSALQERLLDLDPKDFIDYIKKDDVIGQFRRQTQEFYFHINMMRYYGTTDLNEIAKKIENDYTPQIEELRAKGDNKTADEYVEQLKNDILVFKSMFNRMRGRSAQGEFKGSTPYLVAKTLTTAASLPLGQGMALSQLPDLAVIAKKLASTSYAKDVQELNRVLGTNTFKAISKDTLIKIGLVADDMDFKSVNLFDSTSAADMRASHSQYGRKLNKAQEQIYKYNLMRFVNNSAKQAAAPLAADSILAASYRFVNKTATKADEELFQMLGLKWKRVKGIPSDAEKFIKELEANKTVEEGVTFGNSDRWTTEVGVNFKAALREYVNAHFVIEPGMAATKPLWFDTTIGQLMGQYKGFTVRALETHLAKSLQQSDAEALTIFLIRGILGSISSTAKAVAFGTFNAEEDLKPEKLIYNGLMSGGGLAGLDMLSGYMHQLSTATGLPLSIPNALGIYDARRSGYGSDLLGQTMAGASYKLYKDTSRSLNNLAKGKMTYEDWKYLERYVPVYGAFYTQAIINQIR